MYKYLIFFFIIILTSCVSLGYDPHNKPIPEQAGKSFSIKQSERTLISIPLFKIEKPKNHEAGWDEDDVILVYRSSLIKPEFSSRWGWSS
ncbi:MAG: hypothetical protein GY760_09650, partial [Deltaproteobacteria bacterium]|nr:hypothetical protein [Deltaproteobacteria bacterium]